jgi:A/G-specific adenine glycosylase
LRKYRERKRILNAGVELRSGERGFPSRLMRWYSQHKRALPWRCEPTPYRVWISEIMLQQTQAVTASSFYVRFLDRFPNLESLAAASEQEILELWSGLGYYSRARNLHKAAREIISRYHGVFPSDLKSILDLPGIGRYTAGAICSLAFNQSQPIVDGNIRRVITRFNAIVNRAPESYFWDQMIAWIPDGKASIFNQAMMELGALVCTPLQPHCTKCPIKIFCLAYERSLQTSLPRPIRKKPARKLEMIILILQRRGKLLITNKTPDFIPGKWGLPSYLLPVHGSIEFAARSLSKNLWGAIPLSYCAKISHAIGNRRITAHIFIGQANKFLSTQRSQRWIEQSRSKEAFTSSLFIKALTKIEA